jgi:GntR family transcriptional regulator
MGANRARQKVLSRSSPEPLYRQLAGHLENEIGSGRLKPGDRLESEGLLTHRFQVSRITLRQAVAELVRKQLLVRKQGKGTFVTAPAVRHDLRRSHGLLG